MSSRKFNDITFRKEEDEGPQGTWVLPHPLVSLMSPHGQLMAIMSWGHHDLSC